MTLELPVLRLGLAGFSAQQHEALSATLRKAAGAAMWELARLDDADAWCVAGAGTQAFPDGRIRVAAAMPTERALQVHLADVTRPVAFGLPLPAALEARYTFDINAPASMYAVLEKFEGWLAPTSAQFCLAAHIVEHHAALRSGVYDVSIDGSLLAVVDMRGEVGVLPHAGAGDFEEAVWGHRSGSAPMPEHFARLTLSESMWQYAVRTHRDLLPRHYRTGLLYFRRPPRVPQRMLTDSHLLLMRELLISPATFQELQVRSGMREARLAHDLAALYFVGSITSNPKRAAPLVRRGDEADSIPHSNLPSGLDSVPPAHPVGKSVVASDLTVPAPLRPR